MATPDLMSAEGLISFIQESSKTTPVKVYVKGSIQTTPVSAREVKIFHADKDPVVIGDLYQVQALLESNKATVDDIHVEYDRRNSAVPLLDYREIEARIEPGALIRSHVEIGAGCIIMMGAVINIGAVIGERTMIDMNAVVGGRAIVGVDCHIGAGAVLAGVIEPPSAKPVTVGDNVLVGANAVIVEGIEVGRGSVVAAGAVVIDDVAPDTVVAGIPARMMKHMDENTKSKTQIVDALRALPTQDK
jgi:2,3,4,5-tetrahydropyridine-2,6-dicarboxylate N-acetyltransferase